MSPRITMCRGLNRFRRRDRFRVMFKYDVATWMLYRMLQHNVIDKKLADWPPNYNKTD